MARKQLISNNLAPGKNVDSSMATPSVVNQVCNDSGQPSKRKSASSLLAGRE